MEITLEQASFLAPMFIGSAEHEVKTTRRVLAAMPEAHLDFKLGEKGRTARELMWHICASEWWFCDGIYHQRFGTDGEPAPPATAAEILRWYDENVPPAMAKLRELTPQQWATSADFFGVFNLPVVLYLDFLKSHTVHHRGQLSTYVRAVNGHVPDIYGGSADEPFQTAAV